MRRRVEGAQGRPHLRQPAVPAPATALKGPKEDHSAWGDAIASNLFYDVTVCFGSNAVTYPLPCPVPLPANSEYPYTGARIIFFIPISATPPTLLCLVGETLK